MKTLTTSAPQKLKANRKQCILMIALLLLPSEAWAANRQQAPPQVRTPSHSPESASPSGRSHSNHSAPNKPRAEQASPYRVRLTRVRKIDASNQTPGGETGANQIRISPADYPDDGSGETILTDAERANARTISNRIVHQDGLIPNARGLSNFIWAWGQFLDHDLDLTLTDPANGTANITIEGENDPLGPGPIFFDRSDFSSGSGTPGSPRTQINSITSYLDGSNIYGSDDVRAALIREFTGGRLRISEAGLPPVNDVGLPNAGPPGGFLVGDLRGNENVVLTSLHTLFLREHNRLCKLIALLDPEATDEQVYQLARKIVQAELQIISYEEFLPALLGERVSHACVASPHLPSISTEFATASYRFGHSTLSSNIDLVGAGAVSTISLANAFFNSSFLVDDATRVDQLLAGLPTHPCQEIDTKVVSDLRTFLFGPPGAGGFDLPALNIQRGRDHGLAHYNSMRAAFGLSRVNDFSEITRDGALQEALEELYGSVDNIDAWIGGLAEDHVSGSSTGPLVKAVLMDQFSRLRSADEFFHDRDRDLNTPLVQAVVNLKNHSLSQTVLANTSVRQFSDSPFFAGSIVESDIRVSYNRENDRVHVIGNRENNSLIIIDSGYGLTFFAGTGSLVNGKASCTIPASKKPNMTIDLGAGDDRVILVGLDLKQAVVVLGKETDQLSQLLVRAESFISDVPSIQRPPSPKGKPEPPKPSHQGRR